MTLPSIFHPGSPEAQTLVELTVEIIILCAGIFLLVAGLITYACIKFRARPGQPEPAAAYGNVRLESLWTAIPLLIVTVVMFLTVKTMLATSPFEFSTKPDLIVIGHQWWWEVHYPGADGSDTVTANEIHIPAGKRLLLELRAADVVHDFWVPELGRKIDAVPGHPNQIWLESSHEGTYQGFCAEYCGASHAWMKILVIAQNPLDFADWLAHQRASATLPSAGPAAEGLTLFRQKTCTNCHQIRGLSPTTEIGPDLTHFASRGTLGAGVLANTPTNVAKWLADPGEVKAGVHMPVFGFSKKDTQDLISFLGVLK